MLVGDHELLSSRWRIGGAIVDPARKAAVKVLQT
jgi:hypothetical protein